MTEIIVPLQANISELTVSGVNLETAAEPSMSAATGEAASSATGSTVLQIKPSQDDVEQNGDEESELDFSDDVGDMLPSNKLRSFRGLPSDNKFKKKMRPTLKNITPQGSLYRSRSERSDDQEDGGSEVSAENDLLQSMNFTPEEYAELMNRGRSIKEMPTSIRRKRSIQ